MDGKLRPTLTIALALLVPAFAGCIADDEWMIPLTETDFDVPAEFDGVAGSLTWPDFEGGELRILHHGAFPACDDLAAQFANLTKSNVSCEGADDTGAALNRAITGIGDPEFDVLYGIDNLLMSQAQSTGLFHAYTPQLAERVPDDMVFFAGEGDAPWIATPVDHGVIALNVDSDNEALANKSIGNLFNVRAQADQFVTQDPRTSTPGLGFLLITIQLFGEDDAYDWQDYWTDLFERDVLITPDWSSAYETHFTGGYGIWTEGHIGDRAIVTSYTESPAYEAFYGATDVADVLLAHGSVPAAIQQIQTMGVLSGTPNQAIAEAWIEFTLTDDFQVTAAPSQAVYPVVQSEAAMESVVDTYGDNATIHPAPGTFGVVSYDFQTHGSKVAGWVNEWVALCEQHNCT